MREIYRFVRRVWRRLMLERFLRALGYASIVGLTIGGAGALATKVWVVPWPTSQWWLAWISGGVAFAVLAAAVVAWWWRVTWLDAAMEIDRRFALRERVSSCLALSEAELATPVGQALVEDARRHLQPLDIGDQFRLQVPLSLGAPFALALLLVILALWIPDAAARSDRQAEANAREAELVKTQAEKLQQQLKRRMENLPETGLADAQQMFSQLQRSLEQMRDKTAQDRKETLVQLNDLAKQLQEQRQRLAGSEQLREQMRQMRNLESGPADDLARALKQSNYQMAVESLKTLQEKLVSGQLSDADKAQLAKQLQQMQERLEDIQRAYEEARRELKGQIEAAQRTGDLDTVNRLQKKLDQLNALSSQMNQLNQLAQALNTAANDLQQGNSQQAAANLQAAMAQLEQLQAEFEALQACEGMLSDLEAAREAIAAGQMEASQGMPGSSMMNSQIPGPGLGRGQGQGDRPEEATDTKTYESRVAAKLQKGKAVVTGTAGGPNVSGQSVESIKEAILSDFREQSDPLADQRLPRDQRDHAKEYFQKYVKP